MFYRSLCWGGVGLTSSHGSTTTATHSTGKGNFLDCYIMLSFCRRSGVSNVSHFEIDRKYCPFWFSKVRSYTNNTTGILWQQYTITICGGCVVNRVCIKWAWSWSEDQWVRRLDTSNLVLNSRNILTLLHPCNERCSNASTDRFKTLDWYFSLGLTFSTDHLSI